MPSDSELSRNGELPSGSRHVVGVDLGGTTLRVALADPTGRIVHRWHVSTVQIREPEQVIALMVEDIEADGALESVLGGDGIRSSQRGLKAWTATSKTCTRHKSSIAPLRATHSRRCSWIVPHSP